MTKGSLYFLPLRKKKQRARHWGFVFIVQIVLAEMRRSYKVEVKSYVSWWFFLKNLLVKDAWCTCVLPMGGLRHCIWRIRHLTTSYEERRKLLYYENFLAHWKTRISRGDGLSHIHPWEWDDTVLGDGLTYMTFRLSV